MSLNCLTESTVATSIDAATVAEILRDDDIVKTENGAFIFDPFNPLNTNITKEEVVAILEMYGLPPLVDNVALYQRAFVHRSYTMRPHVENEEHGITIVPKPDNCMPLRTKSNERLEFLGDGVLECVTKFHLYRRFPKENEGFMTEKKIAIVKNETIGRIAYEMGLHKWFILSKNAEEKKTRTNFKKLGCLFEAFLGALFLDFGKHEIMDEDGWFENLFAEGNGAGFQFAQRFVENVFQRHIDWVKIIQDDDNFKNKLQTPIQKEFKLTPEYIELPSEEDGTYKMGVYLCIGQPIHAVSVQDAMTIDELVAAVNGSAEKMVESQDAVAAATRNTKLKCVHSYLATIGEGKIWLFLGSGVHKIKKKAEQMACSEALAAIEW